MEFLDKLFKSKNNQDICTDKNSKYYAYPNDLKEYCEYQDKYQQTWLLGAKYTEKINYHYSNYINSKKETDFNILLDYCNKYIELLPKLKEAQEEDTGINGTIYSNPSYCIAYHKLAMAYEKHGDYDKAINICHIAISQNYSDGTKGDFKSRIERLKKKQANLK